MAATYTSGFEIDLYHLDAAYIAWRSDHTGMATFDLTTRRTPFGGGYMVVAGLQPAIDHILAFRYTEQDLAWLRTVKAYDPAFLDMLADLTFTGDVLAMPEGEIAFAHEPMLRITAPFIEAMLLESGLLRAIGISTLIATKAGRIHLAARGRSFSDFAFRRAHEPMWSTRSAFIGGAETTSYVAAANAMHLPMSGTIPHAIVQAFSDEPTAFREIAATMPAYTLLLDTYDVDRGIDNAIEAARNETASGSGHVMTAVRIDSGDLAAWATLVKSRLAAADMPEVKVFVSGDLDEYKVEELLATGAPIDGFGVGGNLGVGLGTVESGTVGGVIGAVYKLTSIENGTGNEARMKIAGTKSTWPGKKQVYRIGEFDHDVIALDNEPMPANSRTLLQPTIQQGEIIGSQPALQEMQSRALANLSSLPKVLQELTVNEPYEVRFSDGITALRASIESEHTG